MKNPAIVLSAIALAVACAGGGMAVGASTAPHIQTIVRSGLGVAGCPGAYELTGGGVTAPYGRIIASFPQGNAWHVGAVGVNGPQVPRAWAVCTKVG